MSVYFFMKLREEALKKKKKKNSKAKQNDLNTVKFFLSLFFSLSFQGVSPGSLIPPTILLRTPPSLQLIGSLSIQYMHLILKKQNDFFLRCEERRKKMRFFFSPEKLKKNGKKNFFSYPQMYSGSVTR